MKKYDPFNLNFMDGREISDIPDHFEEDWDDALIEGKDESHDVKSIKPMFNFRKVRWLSIGIVMIFLALATRLFQMQIVSGEEYLMAAQDNRYRVHVKRPARGIIYDSEKNILVRNVPSFDLYFIPADLPTEASELESVLSEVNKVIDISEEEYQVVLDSIDDSSFIQVLVQRNIERDKALYLYPKIDELPGLVMETNMIRQYESAMDFAHILGYTGKVTEDEYKTLNHEEYLKNDWLGKNGLELEYESILRGKIGKEQVEVDSNGKIKEIVGVNDPTAGNDIVLTINKELQEQVGKIITSNIANKETRRAVAIVMNPNTGELLAMVSMPQYDNNLFAEGISQEDYSKLLNDEQRPLYNRVVSGVYPPGSTIKPVVALAALEEGIIDQNTVIVDKGVINVTHKYNSDIVYRFVGWELSGLGPMNLFSAIAKSSDIYFYQVGGGFEDMEGLGVDKLGEYYKKFKIGERTGIDLPGEKKGLIPTPEWKEEKKGEQWYLGDTYHMAIGQGDVLTTPLQVASWTATIADGGTIHQPHLVKKIIESDGSVKEIMPAITGDKFASDQNMKLIQRAMRETVLDGSGRALQSLSVSSAGKTGTAQHSGSELNHAWYTGYAPYENPEIVVTVLVEEGGGGDEIAVPITNQIMDYYFNTLKQKQNETN